MPLVSAASGTIDTTNNTNAWRPSDSSWTITDTAGVFIIALDLSNIPLTAGLTLRESIRITNGGSWLPISCITLVGSAEDYAYISLPTPVIYGIKYEYFTSTSAMTFAYDILKRA